MHRRGMAGNTEAAGGSESVRRAASEPVPGLGLGQAYCYCSRSSSAASQLRGTSLGSSQPIDR